VSALAEFLHMGGHAFYVWTAYGVVFAVLTANIIAAVSCQRRVRKDLQRRARRARRSA
jgi:heme exporter protein D